MKKPLILLALSLLSFNSFAAVKYKNIPLDKIWGIRCNHHGINGSYTTDFQVTTSYFNDSADLDFQYIDSTNGDHRASARIDNVITAKGDGTDTITYSGNFLYTSGKMFKGTSRVAVTIDFSKKLPSSPSKYLSQFALERSNGDDVTPKLPAWTKGTKMYCELVPLR